MPRKYVKIACSIGKHVREGLKRTEREPLPRELADLANRLEERVEPKRNNQEPKKKAPAG
jgi:hypothetical protein